MSPSDRTRDDDNDDVFEERIVTSAPSLASATPERTAAMRRQTLEAYEASRSADRPIGRSGGPNQSFPAGGG